MFIKEFFTKGRSGEGNEDRYLDTPSWTVLADGGTTKNIDRKLAEIEDEHGATGGEIVADLICEIVSGAETESTPAEVIERVNREYSRVIGDLAPAIRPSATFIAVNKVEGWIMRVGDTSWRTEKIVEIGEHKIDLVHAEARRLYIAASLASGQIREEYLALEDSGREFILPGLRLQWALRNHPDSEFGYGAVDGERIPERFIEVWRVPEEAETLVLATDGYPHLEITLEETEEYLLNSLREDPMRVREYPDTKGFLGEFRLGSDGFLRESFDDRTYLRLGRLSSLDARKFS